MRITKSSAHALDRQQNRDVFSKKTPVHRLLKHVAQAA
jgi:hypothetical protein